MASNNAGSHPVSSPADSSQRLDQETLEAYEREMHGGVVANTSAPGDVSAIYSSGKNSTTKSHGIKSLARAAIATRRMRRNSRSRSPIGNGNRLKNEAPSGVTPRTPSLTPTESSSGSDTSPEPYNPKLSAVVDTSVSSRHKRSSSRPRSRTRTRSSSRHSIRSYAGEDHSKRSSLGRSVHTSPGIYYDHVSVVTSNIAGTEDDEDNPPRAVNTVPSFAHVSPDEQFRVIVVLLNPLTRKFELIHVYYDNDHAMVRDILERTPRNATYEPLQKQKYVALCRPNSRKELINSYMTKDYNIQNDEILVAIPRGYTAAQCAEYAKPIITNARLVKMIQNEDPRWKEENARDNGVTFDDNSTIASSMVEDDDILKELLIRVVERFILPPIRVAITPFQKSKKQRFEPQQMNYAAKMRQQRKQRKKVVRSAVRVMMCMIFLASFHLGRLANEAHLRPIQAGDTLVPGQWWSDCGIMGKVMPSKCRTVEVSPDGHSLTLRDNRTVLWEMKAKESSHKKNVSVLKVTSRGRVMMQDNKAKKIELNQIQATVGKKEIKEKFSWFFKVVPPKLLSIDDYEIHWWGLK